MLINEACSLAKVHQMEWKDRAHFFAKSLQMVRPVLVGHAHAAAGKRADGLANITRAVS